MVDNLDTRHGPPDGLGVKQVGFDDLDCLRILVVRQELQTTTAEVIENPDSLPIGNQRID